MLSPSHFGGDATYVCRPAAEVGARGHDVDVIHDVDAYHLSHAVEPAQSCPSSEHVTVHRLASRFRWLSPLATHQTGLPLFEARLRRQIESGGYDVVHCHNASLIGPDAFGYGEAVKLYTIHEHWLVCPLSLLWKSDRRICDGRLTGCCTRASRDWRPRPRRARSSTVGHNWRI